VADLLVIGTERLTRGVEHLGLLGGVLSGDDVRRSLATDIAAGADGTARRAEVRE
jgi:hypothetical protein